MSLFLECAGVYIVTRDYNRYDSYPRLTLPHP